jgi:hypothetical protein
MTLSDENTTIYHRANSCVTHPDREARNLCIECGQWFCDECMSATHKYLCARCAAEAVREADQYMRSRRQRRSNKRSLPLLFGGLFLLALLLSRLGIGLVILPILFFLLVKHALGSRRDVFSAKRHLPVLKIFPAKKNENVTKEQLDALFRIGNGRITAEKLAQATDVNIKTAQKLLDRQVVNGTLDVEAGVAELIYIKK